MDSIGNYSGGIETIKIGETTRYEIPFANGRFLNRIPLAPKWYQGADGYKGTCVCM